MVDPLGRIRRSTRLRTLRVSIASLAVLVGAGTFALGPTQVGLSMTVNETFVGGNRQVLYGSVEDGDGEPVPRTIVRLFHRADGHRVWDMRTRTDGDGLYRKVLHEEPGRYQVVIRLAGTDIRARRAIRLRDGWQVLVSAEVTEDGQLTLLPIFHY